MANHIQLRDFPNDGEIGSLENGSFYTIPSSRKIGGGQWTDIGIIGNLILKVPTPQTLLGVEENSKEISSYDTVRKPEGIERPENFPELCKQFPSLAKILDIYPSILPRMDEGMARAYFYFLATYNHNYERLCKFYGLNLPSSRFIFIADDSKIFPVVAQYKLKNTISLSSMYSRFFGRIKLRFKYCLPQISSQLAPLLNGQNKDHLDFSPENWLFVESEEKIYYIDLEPTFLIGRKANDHNRDSLIRFFT